MLDRATAARHLYTQAQVSAWAQYFEPQAMQQLRTLSQVSLLRLSHELRNLGIELQFADIPFIAKTKGKSAGNAA